MRGRRDGRLQRLVDRSDPAAATAGAPAVDHVELRRHYGAELSYWYLWSNPSAAGVARDLAPEIVITGVNGLTIFLRHPDGPSPTVREWKHYSVVLREGAGWQRGNGGLPATRADIENILADVEQVLLRASRRQTSGDNNYIDEVRLDP